MNDIVSRNVCNAEMHSLVQTDDASQTLPAMRIDCPRFSLRNVSTFLRGKLQIALYVLCLQVQLHAMRAHLFHSPKFFGQQNPGRSNIIKFDVCTHTTRGPRVVCHTDDRLADVWSIIYSPLLVVILF